MSTDPRATGFSRYYFVNAESEDTHPIKIEEFMKDNELIMGVSFVNETTTVEVDRIK